MVDLLFIKLRMLQNQKTCFTWNKSTNCCSFIWHIHDTFYSLYLRRLALWHSWPIHTIYYFSNIKWDSVCMCATWALICIMPYFVCGKQSFFFNYWTGRLVCSLLMKYEEYFRHPLLWSQFLFYFMCIWHHLVVQWLNCPSYLCELQSVHRTHCLQSVLSFGVPHPGVVGWVAPVTPRGGAWPSPLYDPELCADSAPTPAVGTCRTPQNGTPAHLCVWLLCVDVENLN